MNGIDWLRVIAAVFCIAYPPTLVYLLLERRWLKRHLQSLEEANRDYQRIIDAMVKEYEDTSSM